MKHREDNTFIIEKNNMPYQVIQGAAEYQGLLNQYNSNPELFEEEIVYKPTLDNIKANKKAEAKYLIEESIFNVYPQYKQNNIAIFGTDEEKLAFKNFKIFMTSKYDEIINEIDEYESIEDIDLIEINFNN